MLVQDMVDQYLMSVCAPKAIAPVIDLTLAQQVICPSVPHQSERLEPAQALSLDVDKARISIAEQSNVSVCMACVGWVLGCKLLESLIAPARHECKCSVNCQKGQA